MSSERVGETPALAWRIALLRPGLPASLWLPALFGVRTRRTVLPGVRAQFPSAGGYGAGVLATVLPWIMWAPASPASGTRVRAECRSHPREVEAIAVEFGEKKKKRGPWFYVFSAQS